MHLAIDGNEANITKRVGSNHFAYQLLKSLHDHPGNDQITVYLKNQPVPDMPPQNDFWEYRVLTPPKLWTQWRLPLNLYLHQPRPQVYFSPGHYAPRKSPIPSAVTILDLAFLHYPNLFEKYKKGTQQLKRWTAYSIKQAQHLFAISRYTKKDIVEHYDTKASNITVIYPGVDRKRFQPADPNTIESLKLKYHLPDEFILYLGTIQPRKNLIRLLKAFESLPPKFKRTHLVLAGQKGWLYDEFEKKLEQSPNRDRIHQIGYVEDTDLPALYSAANCLVLVGLHEGFGMPPAEALSCNTIPVVSNNTSLPEVVGQAGIKVDPFSVTSIRHGLVSCLTESHEKKLKRLALANKHLRQFKWQKSAATVREVLHDIALQR